MKVKKAGRLVPGGEQELSAQASGVCLMACLAAVLVAVLPGCTSPGGAWVCG